MSERQVSDWIEGFLEYTDNTEPPVLFRKWVAISAIASVLKRKCMMQYGHLRVYPNMYIVLVSPPGQARKGTAIGFGIDFLMRAEVKLCADRITKEALIRNIKQAYDTEISPDGSKMRNHCSFTIISPEFTVLLGRNDPEMISFLADWFDCGKGPDGIWEYETKGQGKDKITGLWVNLLAATTPDLIGLVPEIIGSGLSSRIIFVFEERHGKIVPYPFLTDKEIELGEKLYHDLENIQLMSGNFKWDSDFIDVWFDWYPKQMENPPFKDARLARYCTRRGINIIKLSLILSAARSSDRMVTGDDLARAIKLLEETEVKMPRVFHSMGDSPYAKVLNDMMMDIGNAGKIKLSTLVATYYNDVSDPHIFDGILKTLENMKFCIIYQELGETWVKHLKK